MNKENVIYKHIGIFISFKNKQTKKELLTFATTWMNLEDIMVSKSHRKTNAP
jgi:hypothetical protein